MKDIYCILFLGSIVFTHQFVDFRIKFRHIFFLTNLEVNDISTDLMTSIIVFVVSRQTRIRHIDLSVRCRQQITTLTYHTDHFGFLKVLLKRLPYHIGPAENAAGHPVRKYYITNPTG